MSPPETETVESQNRFWDSGEVISKSHNPSTYPPQIRRNQQGTGWTNVACEIVREGEIADEGGMLTTHNFR